MFIRTDDNTGGRYDRLERLIGKDYVMTIPYDPDKQPWRPWTPPMPSTPSDDLQKFHDLLSGSTKKDYRTKHEKGFYVIEMACSGCTKKDLKVTLENGQLAIKIEKGMFKGKELITVPRDYDLKQVTASVKNGLLTVKVAKTEFPEIEIK